jgi:hypothetical protein
MSVIRNPCRYEGSSVLLVEGINDCHVVFALCVAHGVPENFGIYECGSDDKVLRRLNALIVQPDAPKIIGAILDADRGVASRWESIKAKLAHHGYNFSEAPDISGTIIETNGDIPKIGFWLMPDNKERGMLEDFCNEMMEAKTKEYVARSVALAQRRGVCTFKAAHLSKAIVHTYLAWQDEPGLPLGLSITNQSLKPDTRTAQEFTNWLTRLFQQ